MSFIIDKSTVERRNAGDIKITLYGDMMIIKTNCDDGTTSNIFKISGIKSKMYIFDFIPDANKYYKDMGEYYKKLKNEC